MAWWCLLYIVETCSRCHNRYNKSYAMTGHVFTLCTLHAQRRCHTLSKVSMNNRQPTPLNFPHERVLNGSECSGTIKCGEFSDNTPAAISFSRRTVLHEVGWATQWTDTFTALTHSLCQCSGVYLSSNNYTFDTLSNDPITRLHPVHFL